MRISNDVPTEGEKPMTELMRLQAEFQGRLAEETLQYLRKLRGVTGPPTPGTVVFPEKPLELHAAGAPGTRVEFRLEVENRQPVHCMVTPMLAPLTTASGVTWFPLAKSVPASALLASGEMRTIAITADLPENLPQGTYRGALILLGFREGGIPATVTVQAAREKAGKSSEAARRRATTSVRRPRRASRSAATRSPPK